MQFLYQGLSTFFRSAILPSIPISFQEYVTRIAGEITLGSDYWWIGITYNEEKKVYEYVDGVEINTDVT